jgi:condensin complex subunit 2
VDPLFKKTSADFDEGGARGLLLNHLHISYDGRMIFDASNDAGFLHDYTPSDEKSSDSPLDMEQLRGNLHVISLTLKGMFETILADIEEKEVCPSFKEFQFNSNNLDFDPLQYLQANMNNLPAYVDAEPDEPMAPDGFEGYMPHDSYDDDNDVLPANTTAIPDLLLDMRRTRLSIMPDDDGADPAEHAEFGRGNDIGLFSYFDKALIRNWMGPEHWRPMPSKSKKD